MVNLKELFTGFEAENPKLRFDTYNLIDFDTTLLIERNGIWYRLTAELIPIEVYNAAWPKE